MSKSDSIAPDTTGLLALAESSGSRSTGVRMLKVITAVRAGSVGISRACEVAGIHRDTYYAWLRRAAQGEEPFLTFQVEFDKARAARVEELEGKLRDADDWKAQNALLARYDMAKSAGETVAQALDSLSFAEQVEAAAKHPDVIKRVLEDQRRKALEGGEDE